MGILLNKLNAILLTFKSHKKIIIKRAYNNIKIKVDKN